MDGRMDAHVDEWVVGWVAGDGWVDGGGRADSACCSKVRSSSGSRGSAPLSICCLSHRLLCSRGKGSSRVAPSTLRMKASEGSPCTSSE